MKNKINSFDELLKALLDNKSVYWNNERVYIEDDSIVFEDEDHIPTHYRNILSVYNIYRSFINEFFISDGTFDVNQAKKYMLEGRKVKRPNNNCIYFFNKERMIIQHSNRDGQNILDSISFYTKELNGERFILVEGN